MHDKKYDDNSLFSFSLNPLFDTSGSIDYKDNNYQGGGTLTITFSGVIDQTNLDKDVNGTSKLFDDFYSALTRAGFSEKNSKAYAKFSYLLWGSDEQIAVSNNVTINVPLLLAGDTRNPGQFTGITINISQSLTIDGQIYQLDGLNYSSKFNIDQGGGLSINNACLLTADFDINGSFTFGGNGFEQTEYDISTDQGQKSYKFNGEGCTYNNGSNIQRDILHLYDSHITLSGRFNGGTSGFVFVDYGSTITLNGGSAINGYLVAGWNNNKYTINGIFELDGDFILSGDLEFNKTSGFNGNGQLVISGQYYDGTKFNDSVVNVQPGATIGNLDIGYDPFYQRGYGGYNGTSDKNAPTNSDAQYGGTLNLYGDRVAETVLTGILSVGGSSDHHGVINIIADQQNDVFTFNLSSGSDPKNIGITVNNYGEFISVHGFYLDGTLDVNGGTVTLGAVNSVTYLKSEGGTLTCSDNFTISNINETGGSLNFNVLDIKKFTGDSDIICGISISGGSLTIGSFQNDGGGDWHLGITGTGSANIIGASQKNSIYAIDISTSGNNSFSNLNITTTLDLETGNTGTTELKSGTYPTIQADGGTLTIDAGVSLTTINLGEKSGNTGSGATVNLVGPLSFNDLEAYYGSLKGTNTTTIGKVHEQGGDLTFDTLVVTGTDSGDFSIGGGTLTASDIEYTGTLLVSGSGNVTLKGGNVTTIDLETGLTGIVSLGGGSYGTVNINGGTLDITGNLQINDLEAQSGSSSKANDQTAVTIQTFHETGGDLTFDKLVVTGTDSGDFSIGGGTLTASDIEYVGTLLVSGSGSVTLEEGNVSAIDFKKTDTSNSTMNLTLTTLTLEDGNKGVVDLTGGTYTTINIAGGGVNITGGVTIGDIDLTAGYLIVGKGGIMTYTGNTMVTPIDNQPMECLTLQDGGILDLTQSNVDITGCLYAYQGGFLNLDPNSNSNILTIAGGVELSKGDLTITGSGTVTIGNLLSIQADNKIILNTGVNLVVEKADPGTAAAEFLLKSGSSLTFNTAFTSDYYDDMVIDFDKDNMGAVLKFGSKVDQSTDDFSTFVIQGFNIHDAIDFQGLDFNSLTFNSITYSTDGKLIIKFTDKTTGQAHEFDFDDFDKRNSPFAGDTQFYAVNDGSGGVLILSCFLPGSQILTSSGYKAVEMLKIGEEIHTFTAGSSKLERITWIGKNRCDIRSDLPDDFAGYPVRILKDAIAPNVPFQDLYITSEHCLCFDNQFIPIRMLVNGQSIFYDRSFKFYDYYHIETESHAIIKANGLLTETYLDTGDRGTFEKCWGPQLTDIHPIKTWSNDAAAPLVVEQEIIEPIFNRIKQRAEQIGFRKQNKDQDPILIEDPDLYLITDNGTIIQASDIVKGIYTFTLPPKVKNVRIMSRSSRPCDTINPFIDDRRFLGVLVGSITLTMKGQLKNINDHLEHQQLFGWYGIENDICRWTNGNAYLSLKDFVSETEEILSFEILSKGPYLIM